MLESSKIVYRQGRQFLKNLTSMEVPGIFRGRPVISFEKVNERELAALCPTEAILGNPISIDLGKCTFCGECAKHFPRKISFTKDYKLATNSRNDLIIKEGDNELIELNQQIIRNEIHALFGSSLKLRQISAGGDNSCELELNAANNVQFDLSRFGIEFVASPRRRNCNHRPYH